jgi:hypothetical protein
MASETDKDLHSARCSRASNSFSREPVVISAGVPEVDEDEHWMWVARVLGLSE